MPFPQLYTAYLLATLAAAAILMTAAAVAAYKWGRAAGERALASGSPKWQVYITALCPVAAFSLTLLCDPRLGAFAFQVFAGLAAPAVVGAGLRINQPQPALL